MYDCSRNFNEFYHTKVILPEKSQNELRKKRKTNIKRLKSGLSEYNSENNTGFRISEERIQGSMAMHTVVQNDENDYDIDVGIVFESDNLDEIGPHAIKNILENALKRKMGQFAAEPLVKTSCVRMEYSNGYHVDFAIFKRSKIYLENEYTYEHAGAKWSTRHIKALEEWFNTETSKTNDNLRKIVRLSKMFCKSRKTWKNMPSGLIQTVLCDEAITNDYSRTDELFYYTMKKIVDRLNVNLEVNAPVDNERKLVIRDIDYTRVQNWKNRLENELTKLDVLFNPDCTFAEAVDAWGLFFNHSYWKELNMHETRKSLREDTQEVFNNTEEHIEDKYLVNEYYDVSINCKISGNGIRPMPIEKYLDSYFAKFIPHNFSVTCKIDHADCPPFDKVLWKVLNVGEESVKRNDIRGQILDRGEKITENTIFRGQHYIECYLIKNDICIAIGHVDIPIG
ncbi:MULTISPECIES: nucleotide-binding domain-containing protein [Lactobacillaceae]|uniref:nucleotide-binding domain-containing protein n=1 Tax=Lactobacillaceae TaxID=33958 RepID=UPI002223E69B|nr:MULTISPECIES: nucleotidyltransferase [Lactobacillaceae]MCW1911755.1 nucleotidyltransferase [Lactiplantibacillus paraplantarum]MDB1563072.1 nucleotidyltransferase [Pediococcus pentosaceus]MDH5112603.1 nucleotidyltransferase [Lactiplantibacillus plantarum]MDN7090213.1 nucleotidyltransferase [Lactiplantibacillus plantarum]